MLIMKSRKRQMTEGNRTTKSIKNQNAQRKENLEIIGNTGSRHHQTCGDERKN